MEDFLTTFHIDWRLMLAQTFNFVVVLVALYYLASKPLRKIIKERTREIEKGLEKGKKNSELLEKTEKEYSKMLIKAKLEANNILEDTKKDALVRKEEMIIEARKEVEVLIDNGKKSLESEKKKMLADTEKEIAGLVIQVTEKVLKDRVDEKYGEEVIKELNNI